MPSVITYDMLALSMKNKVKYAYPTSHNTINKRCQTVFKLCAQDAHDAGMA